MLSLTDTDEVVKVMAKAGLTIPAIHEAARRAADTFLTSRIENPPLSRYGTTGIILPFRNATNTIVGC